MVRRAYDATVKQLAHHLRELREASGRTLETAAEAVGMHAKHLQRIENGTVNVTLKTLVAISVAYGVSLPDVFALKPERAGRRSVDARIPSSRRR